VGIIKELMEIWPNEVYDNGVYIMGVSNVMLRMQKDEQVDMGTTSLLELNGANMSNSSTKETIINELEECFLLLLKDL